MTTAANATTSAPPLALDEATRLYVDRQERRSHPDGTFDRGGRWYPSDAEWQSCCSVRTPSRAYPYSLLVHCRTATHVAKLANNPDVTPAAIRREARKLTR